jgi:hypothetical protein
VEAEGVARHDILESMVRRLGFRIDSVAESQRSYLQGIGSCRF